MHWTERIVIDRPEGEVRAAIADEHELMAWSAWPEATGLRCAVETGDGRSVGSEIVFRDASGAEQGRQRLAAVGERRVEYRLRNRGPRGRELRPEVDFVLGPLGPARTRVELAFRVELPLPPGVRQLAGAVVGRRLRALHVRDLEQLKAHVERRPAVAA